MDKQKQEIEAAVQTALQYHPKADRRILLFIETFRRGTGNGTVNQEIIRTLFRDGYCYYFALMLKDAFPEGEICWAAPFGHIVFVHNGIPYDIGGVYCGEPEDFIQVRYMEETIDDFRHVPGVECNATEQQIARIMVRYQEEKHEDCKKRPGI